MSLGPNPTTSPGKLKAYILSASLSATSATVNKITALLSAPIVTLVDCKTSIRVGGKAVTLNTDSSCEVTAGSAVMVLTVEKTKSEAAYNATVAGRCLLVCTKNPLKFM